MAEKNIKCKCGKKLVLDVDKFRGKCGLCASKEYDTPRKRKWHSG